DGAVAAQVKRGQVVADEGVTSFLHVDDAASATLAALDWPAGIFNIVDDEPAPGTTWLPVYAATLGAPAPATSTEHPRGARGATNAKARLQGWQPAYASWRTGFRLAAQTERDQA
ncbi:MAG TPA: NAD(P)-dependent oxidoreductase, partial [Ktedonobacteraceae bacterium]|nr:NAD(P)-dependent oxidoreductase [Ktedonobacteraceae bacterium]